MADCNFATSKSREMSDAPITPILPPLLIVSRGAGGSEPLLPPSRYIAAVTDECD